MSTTAFKKTALTGGGASALDGIDGAGLLDGDFAFVYVSGVAYFYILDDDSAKTESSPYIISPNTNAGNKRWILQSTMSPAVAAVKNPLSPAQGVNMTAAASGGGITVADDADIDFGTGNYTICWRGSLPAWKAAYSPYLVYKFQDSTNRWWLYNEVTSGKITYLHQKTGGTTVVVATTAGNTFGDGTVHEIVCVVTRETASNPGSVSFYYDGLLHETVAIPAGTPADIDNTGSLYINGHSTVRHAGTTYFAATYNRCLSAAEVLDLYRNGIAWADKWGSQTEATSGTLTIGKKYRINNWIDNDDFTNVGGANVDGTEFTATGTTPTHWAHSSTVVEIGATLALEPEGIQPSPGQWLDSSSNKLHAMQPAAGSSLVRKQDTFEVRWTNTWAGTHEAQYVGGVNQAVLPPGSIRIESITMVVTGAAGNVVLGDGNDVDHFVASVALAAYLDCTVASRSHDGTNMKLVIDPDTNLTGSISTTVKGVILQ